MKQHADQNVSLLELNLVLIQCPELLTKTDGVHPNAAGYLKIAEAVAQHITQLAYTKLRAAQLRSELLILPNDLRQR